MGLSRASLGASREIDGGTARRDKESVNLVEPVNRGYSVTAIK
jgi:hypothetical protein